MSFVVRQRLREAQERQEAERERLSQQASVQAQQEQAQQSTLSVVATQDIKPSQNVATFARETGLPVSVVSKRADLLDQEQRRTQVFETLRRAPILSKVVANPNMAATLQESLDQLAEFEEKNSVRLSVRQAGNFFHDQAKAQMARMSVGSDPIRRARDEDRGLIERLEYEAVRLLIGEGAPRVLGAGQKAAAAASGVVQVPEMMTAIVGGLERGVRRPVGRALEETGIPGLQQVGQLIVSTTELQAPIFDALSEELTALRETLQPEEMDYLDKVAQGVGQFAAQLAVFVATGGLPAFAAAFAMGGGQQELRMREQGIDSSKHGLALLGGGAATAWTEITRFNRFMKILPPSARQRVSSAFAGSIGKAAQRNVTRIAGTVAREAAEEATQEAIENTLQNAVAKFTYEPDAEIFEGFVESLTVGGGVGAVVAAMLEVVLPGRLRDVETDTTKKSIEEMRDVVQAAVATTQHKQDVEEYINTATENETVGLDADGVNELFQDDPEGTRAMLEALGVSEAQIQRALEGDDILVAVSKLATMEDQGQFDQLVDIARTRPEAKTPREARRDAEEGLGPELTEQLNQILDENVAFETDERIEQNVRDQLLRAGESRDVANAGGLIWSRVFRMLEMRGVDTAALYEQLGLQVVGPGLEQPEVPPEAQPEPAAPTVAPETTAKSQSLLDAFLDSATFNPLLDEAAATASPEELRIIHRQLFGREARGETAQEIADEISRRRIREVDVLDRDDEGRAELAARTLFTDVEGTELEQAKRAGYEGQDTGEAREWIRARDKGLDMSPEARMQRARDMGFDTDRVLYRGSGADETTLRVSRGHEARTIGVSLSPSSETASFYANLAGGDNANVAVYYVKKGDFIDIDDLLELAQRQLDPEGTSGDEWIERATDEYLTQLAKDNGYIGSYFNDGGIEDYRVFDPANIRSVNAAFDPDYADEPTLLAQEAVDTSVAGGLTEKSVITTRSLAGASIVPIFADLTSSGNVYSDLDGMAVTPTPYFGGPNFPYLKDYRDAGMVWAFNKKGPATKLINHVRRLRDKAIEEGRDPRVVVTVLAMKDDAHTSNETVINVLLRTLDAVVKTGQFPQDQLSAAKKLIVGKADKKDEGYSGLATFPGFDDGAKLAAWTRNATFTTRKALANEMRSAKFRQLPGMFPINRIVREAIDPDYRATQQGDALVAFEIDPDADDIIIDFDQPEVRIPRHPAFRFGIKGRLVGSFGTHIPMDILYSDLLAEVTERSKEGSNPKFLMERLRGTDRQIVTDEIVNLAEQIEQLDDYRAAKALVAGALGQWRSSDVDANKGGAAPAEFEQALVENEAAVTLTKYTRKDVFAGRRSGNLTVYQLGSEVVKNGGLNVWMGVKRDVDYRDEYPGEITQQLVDQGVITDKEVALVGVANNELGVRGMATFQVLKGIEEGVTILDAFKVRSPSKPDGLLPAIYATLGFEEVGEIPFDPQYYSDQEITALKAVWSRQGWTEGDGFPAVAIMKWRGDDALRSGATERFIVESQAGLGLRGKPDFDQLDTTTASVFEGDVARDGGDGRPRERDGRADPRSYADRARGLSGRARGFIANILAADERATDALKIDASDVQALRDTYGEVDLKQDQELEAPGERGPRGLTRVPGPLGTGTVLGSVPTLVKLTEAKDKTTFLHESAHVFLEVFAALEDTNPEIAAEMAPVREWLGWEKGKPLTVEMHEKFAGLDGFEGYLSTGKAPAPELRSVFEQFRNWFVKVYEKLRGRELKIDQRARDFFDRMLATEQEISNAERSYHDVLTDTMRGLMTPEQVEKHSKLAERAGRVARDRIFKKHLEQIMRRDRKTYKEAKRRIEEDVRAKLEDLPIFRALAELADEKSPVVLNRAVTEEIVGPDNMAPLEPYVSEEGVDPEGFALSMGFASADEMFQEIASNPDFDIAVEYETRRRLDDLEDDLLVNPDRAEQEAIEATFNDAQVRKLEVERDALAQRALQEPIPLLAIRRRARDVIDNTPIDEVIKPGRYAMQAQSLHKKAVKAAAKGQFDVALRLTHQAMMQHELARYAYKARSEIEKINRFLARFGRTRKLDPKRIAPEFIDPIRTLMAMPGAVDQTAARSVLVQFEALKAQDNIMLELPVEIFTQENLPDRRKMTLQQFRSFRDGVKSLHKNGREQSDVEKAKRAARNQAMADVVIAAWGKRKLKEPTRTPKFMERLMSGIAGLDAAFIRLPFLANILQGDRRGPLADVLYNNLAVAQNRKERRLTGLEDGLRDILRRHNISAAELNRTINEPLLDRNPIHKEKLFVILLNMGNAGNIQRISDDPSLPEALRGNPQAILQLLEGRLEKRHFDAAQEIWDLLETQRDDLGVVHQRRTGVIPTWVEPEELVTKYGTYKGGYYPIKYRTGVVSNKDISEPAVENLFTEFSGGVVSKAQTRNGMVQTRVQSQQREMSWELSNVLKHMADTATMIEMSEAIDDAWSVVSSTAFQDAVAKTWGQKYIKPLEVILKRAAVDATVQETDTSVFNKPLRIARVNTSIAILGLNIKTALLAPVSYLQTVIPRYGFKVVARGWIEWFGRGGAFVTKSGQTMEQKSPFMAERKRLVNREAHDIAQRRVFSGAWSAAQAAGYVPMTMMEKHTVAGPLWWGVYRTALLEGRSEQQAIAEADTAVGTTQGSGRVMDQALMQGSSNEFERVVTFMWGYVSGYYGVVRTDLAGAQSGLAKMAQLAKHLVILNAASAVLEALLTAPFDDDEDDEESQLLKETLQMMARNALLIPGASMIFSRYDTTTAFEGVAKDGQQTFNYAAKTINDYFENGEVDGEMAWRTAQKALETAGFALGVPGTLQAGRVLDVLEQLEEEDEDPSFETFYRALVAGPKDDS